MRTAKNLTRDHCLHFIKTQNIVYFVQIFALWWIPFTYIQSQTQFTIYDSSNFPKFTLLQTGRTCFSTTNHVYQMRNILPTFFLEREKKEKMKFNGRRTGIPNIFPEEKSDFNHPKPRWSDHDYYSITYHVYSWFVRGWYEMVRTNQLSES